MANRRLGPSDLKLANRILRTVRSSIARASGGDVALQWALRRKVYKELSYDERSKPAKRKALKRTKRAAQNGRCALGRHPLPETGAVLDRLDGMAGYTETNTRLLCPRCDLRVQRQRGYRDLP